MQIFVCKIILAIDLGLNAFVEPSPFILGVDPSSGAKKGGGSKDSEISDHRWD